MPKVKKIAAVARRATPWSPFNCYIPANGSRKTATTAQRIIQQLKKRFEENRDEKNAAQVKQYMRNQFEFYGIKAPERRSIVKQVVHDILPKPDTSTVREVIALSWHEEYRDFQNFAVDYACKYHSVLAGDTPEECRESLGCVQAMICTKSWWDTVDAIASNVVGPMAQAYPEVVNPVVDAWIHATDMWVRRTAIIHQLTYKDATDKDKLFRYCLICCHEKEFFIQKAIGWALRQYARTDPDTVKKFVKDNESKLAKLSIKEAMKHL